VDHHLNLLLPFFISLGISFINKLALKQDGFFLLRRFGFKFLIGEGLSLRKRALVCIDSLQGKLLDKVLEINFLLLSHFVTSLQSLGKEVKVHEFTLFFQDENAFGKPGHQSQE
jgi:hypothetical protein